jgi:hypothetical protein
MNDFKKAALSRMVVLAVLVVSGGCNYIKIVETGEGFLVTEGRQKILFYQRKSKSLDGKYSRANYVHPLYSLDGQIFTEDFPADHLHHHGIFWAWHQIYVGDKKMGDGWSTKDISWDVYDAKILAVDSQSRALQVGVYWKSPLWTDASGKQKPFVKETTTITVQITKKPTAASQLAFDCRKVSNSPAPKALSSLRERRLRLAPGSTSQADLPTTVKSAAWLFFVINPIPAIPSSGYFAEKALCRTPCGPAGILLCSPAKNRSFSATASSSTAATPTT